MSDIKRTGPPTARDVRGKIYTWTMPLNAMPSREWRQFFVQTKDTTVTCNPHRVTLYQGLMIFESTEDDVLHWVSFIDKWMAAANARYGEWEAEQRRRRGSDLDTRDRAQRLVEMNEKFKHL